MDHTVDLRLALGTYQLPWTKSNDNPFDLFGATLSTPCLFEIGCLGWLRGFSAAAADNFAEPRRREIV